MANWSRQHYTIRGYGATVPEAVLLFSNADELRDLEVKTVAKGRQQVATLTFETRWLPAAGLLQDVADCFPRAEIEGTATDDMLNYAYELVFSEGVWTARDRLPDLLNQMDMEASPSRPPFAYADREQGPLFQLLATEDPIERLGDRGWDNFFDGLFSAGDPPAFGTLPGGNPQTPPDDPPF